MPGVGGAVGEAGKQRGISGSTVKIVAVITMLIDHAGAVILARLIIGRGYLESLGRGLFRMILFFFLWGCNPLQLFQTFLQLLH